MCFDPYENATASYQSDLDTLLNSLSSAAAVNSFYTDKYNELYGFFLCRGDISIDSCQVCVKTATQTIRHNCTTNKMAIIWYDICMLRYSNYSFFGKARVDLGGFRWNYDNISSNENDSGALALIYDLIDKAPKTSLMFGIRTGTNRYAMVQCTRDISSNDCSSCLSTLVNNESYYPKYCKGKIGWHIFTASCSMRYENYSFLDLPASTPPSPSPMSTVPQYSVPSNGTTGENSKKGNKTIIIVVAIGVSLSAIVAALLGFCCYKRRKSGMTQEILLQQQHIRNSIGKDYWDSVDISETDQESRNELCFYDLAIIHAATNNFSISNKLGEGGFGPVFKAWKLWSEEKAMDLIDSKIADSCPKTEALQWIHIALLCIEDDPARRPTMSEVVRMLGSESLNLPPPTAPPYTISKLISFSDMSSLFGTGTGTGTRSLSTDKSTITSTSEMSSVL
ncbi:hypothetical protein ACFE04_000213 [Oxalis oulophora]